MKELIKNDEIRALVKAISSNLIRAQREEGRDLNYRNRYLEAAGSDSILLGRLLLDEYNNKVESSEYFLSAGHSFEESGALNPSRTCYEKVIEIGLQDFKDIASEGLEGIEKLEHRRIDLNTKEDRLNGLDHIVWTYKGLNTIQAVEYMKKDFGLELSRSTIRTYARELEERKRVAIWGGPQGRIYHIYPNLANLATRKDYYGDETVISGSIEDRVSFKIQFQNWRYNKEIFVLNGSKRPKWLMTVDMNAYVKNLDKLTKIGYSLEAVGTLQDFQSLAVNGYVNIKSQYQDVLDSRILIDSNTGEQIYNRHVSEVG